VRFAKSPRRLCRAFKKTLILTGSLASALLWSQTPNSEALTQANLGVAAAHKEDYRAAIQAYKRAIAIDPNLPGIYLNLGLAWFKLGNFSEAAAAFEQANNKSPSEQGTTLLAMSDFGLHRYKQASHLLAPLAAANPANTELSYLLAKCYLWSGQYDAATTLFKKLMDRDPNSAAVHMLMGEALDADDKTADAAIEFEAAAKADPAQPDVHFGLGFLYWKLRRYDDAERELRAELKNNPKSAQSFAYLGDLLIKTGRPEEATASLKQAVALRPELELPHQDLGILYAGQKRNDAAVSELRRAIQCDPNAYEPHYRLARLYREMGKTVDANAEFAIVQKLHKKKTEDTLMKISGPQ